MIWRKEAENIMLGKIFTIYSASQLAPSWKILQIHLQESFSQLQGAISGAKHLFCLSGESSTWRMKQSLARACCLHVPVPLELLPVPGMKFS